MLFFLYVVAADRYMIAHAIAVIASISFAAGVLVLPPLVLHAPFAVVLFLVATYNGAQKYNFLLLANDAKKVWCQLNVCMHTVMYDLFSKKHGCHLPHTSELLGKFLSRTRFENSSRKTTQNVPQELLSTPLKRKASDLAEHWRTTRTMPTF